ncbi:hypothetical protein J4429_00335 [Candidatus Pacearchaeota archaeon]|nr:hypothetical protein [Candidatus Pacearchaeota archaeon]
MNNQSEKPRLGLYNLLFRRLDELQRQSKKEIIPFPMVFVKLCSNFSIKKNECWELLFLIRDMGIIEIIPHHGIRLKEEINFKIG